MAFLVPHIRLTELRDRKVLGPYLLSATAVLSRLISDVLPWYFKAAVDYLTKGYPAARIGRLLARV
jgi:hypothetical protein